MVRVDEFTAGIPGPPERAAYEGSTDPAEARARQLDAIGKAAFNNVRAYANCCRSTLWALTTQLDLDGADSLKASSSLAGGIAGTGETCGAVLGALMAIGLACGPDHPTHSDAPSRTAAARFVERFTERFESTRCYGVQDAAVGWHVDDSSRLPEWIAAGGPIACAGACAEAARIAAEILLDRADDASIKAH